MSIFGRCQELPIDIKERLGIGAYRLAMLQDVVVLVVTKQLLPHAVPKQNRHSHGIATFIALT